MRILITGGTGLIGKAFIECFKNYKYTILTRNIKKNLSINRVNNNFDFIDSLASLKNLNNFDAVINLAGESIIDKRWTDKQKKIICDSRWQITQQLVELFKLSDKPPAVFISSSAIGIYGNRGYDVVDENTSIKICDFPSKICFNWETIANNAKPYTRVVLIRTGIVLSTKGGALVKIALFFKFFLGRRIGDGKQYMSWIHLQDHINAIDYLLNTTDISGAVNLVAPEPQKNIDFTKQLAKTLKRPAIFIQPKTFLKIILGEASCLLLDSQRVVPQKLIKYKFNFKFATLKTALADLLKKS